MSLERKIIEAPFESYFGVFLTLACTFKCDYCVQKISLPNQPIAHYPLVSGKEWVDALNSITGRVKRRFFRPAKRKKISITGGEPTLHPDFVYILNNLDRNWNITVTSNFTSPFFSGNAAQLRQIRKRYYLKFNGSFHFLYTPLDKFIENMLKVKKTGFKVHTIFIVGHPGHMEEIQRYKKELLKAHPLVKVQRFLGYYQGKLYPCKEGYDINYQQEDGIYNYQDYTEGFSQKEKRPVYCRMNKVLFSPSGDMYNCHYKLYTGHGEKMGNIFAKNLHIVLPGGFFLCQDYGFCNPCDAEGHPFKRVGGEEFNISG
ncbi:MAG: radical SAM protein [Candidatus Omnitrophota bacterium]